LSIQACFHFQRMFLSIFNHATRAAATFRLYGGITAYEIAKGCRTSVETIETFYASHIKNTLDAAAINVRKPKPTKKKRDRSKPNDESRAFG
jgi:hypothetical protein